MSDSRPGLRPASVRAALLLPVILVGACSWFTDFKQQPKIDPWETVADTIASRGNPQNSVPVYGSAAPGYAYARDPLPASIEAMSGIPNPVPADAASRQRGKVLFQINCAVCHGPLGHGDGPATRYGMVGINLTMPVTQARTDGYIFGMIRNGRGLMPTYNRIEESERWDVVNYIRELQGRAGAIDTTHGRPGENGATVPGPSLTAPTRPAPYYHYVYPQAGASPVAPRAAADTTRKAPSP
ncbi:MAG TPA: cytochrome c [Gemmatimonadaceae bacterium]|nr:cytochrome c [Gemmatimonadaceae bacterium]